MRLEHLNTPAIPIAYGLLILDAAKAFGVKREDLLANSNIPADIFDKADARLSLIQAGGLLFRAMQLSGNPAFGYEIGLRSNLTSHGFIGYGVLSHPTLRQAIEFGAKFLQLRLPNLSYTLKSDGHYEGIIVMENIPMGSVRQCMFDLFLVGLWRMVPILMPERPGASDDIELWFDYPEPDYYAAYRDRLPKMRFSMPSNQLRFTAKHLDLPMGTANSVTAQLVVEQCERELAVLGFSEDLLGQVRACFNDVQYGYPDQEAVAARLHLSVRTLKRRLQQHGTNFQTLLDEARRRDAIHLMQDSALSIEDIAERIGYSDRANFTRAFRKWTQMTPQEFRQRNQSVTHR